MTDIASIDQAAMSEEFPSALVRALQDLARRQITGDRVSRHLKLASDALHAERERHLTSLFDPNRGTLSPWQLRRSTQLLAEKMHERDASQQAARACNVSVGHFSRAFKMSTGKSPHRWIIGLRIDRAKHLLLNSSEGLVDIARHCGYTEQCHFTRIFTREVGMSPGTWRRIFNSLSMSSTLETTHVRQA